MTGIVHSEPHPALPSTLRSLLILGLLVTCVLLAAPVHAAGVVGDGTPASCTEAALDAALAGGGAVSFNCGGPKTILLLSAKTIAQDTSISGGGEITLTGGLATRLFVVNSGVTLELEDIVLDSAFAVGSDGGAISNSGNLILDRVGIRSCQTDADHSGGAIFTDGPATITNSGFTSNSGGSAGAIFANFGNADVTIRDSTFTSNKTVNATLGYGGAIWVGENARLTVQDSAFIGNSAHFGGALYASPNAHVALDGSDTTLPYATKLQLNSNRATEDGGAIYNRGSLAISDGVLSVNQTPTGALLAGYGGGIFSSGVLTMTNVIVGQNQGRFGGGVFVGNSPTGARAVLDRVTFQRNVSGGLGGGLYTNTGSTIHVTRSVFANNEAVNGGGAARFNARLDLTDSSFTDNTATSLGGGLYVGAGPSVDPTFVSITSVTLSGNSAAGDQGGGIYNQGYIILKNVTLKDNTNGLYNFGTLETTHVGNTVLDNPGTLNCDGDGTPVTSDDYNLSTDNSCALGLSNDQSGIGLDAKLGPRLLDETYFHLPLEGSPLINAAANCPTLDQRGAIRPDACDIGAVEYRGLLPQAFLPLSVR